jgi:hypothetical protein
LPVGPRQCPQLSAMITEFNVNRISVERTIARHMRTPSNDIQL